MNTNSFTKRWLLALGLGCSMQSLWAQGMIVNELSNGVTGNQEYIELLVVGSAASPTGNVDLRGWIIDDNNGEFEGTTGTGLATGHMRIASSCTALSAVRPGALIVVYNANDVGTIMLAPDPTDANGDNVYVFPHTNVCWERSLTAPSASSPAYTPATYGSAAIGDWVTTMAFANGGDAGQTRRPGGAFYHGFSYGSVDVAPFPTFPTDFGGGLSFNVATGSGSGQAYILSCGSWTNAANFNMVAATAGSPGAANNAANAQLVQNILDGTFDYTNLANPNNCTVAPCALAVSTAFTQPSCFNGNNGTATATPSNQVGSVSYNWSSGNTAAIATGLTAGTYFVTVTDSVCAVQDTVIINAPTVLATTNVVTAATCNQANGAINLSVTGGTTPYTFAWSNGATSEDISGLAAGTYRVTTTDANGCTQNSSILLSATSSPTVTFTSTTAACGNSNGTINLTVTGGTTPYTYRWNNGATSEDLSNLQGGVYVATVTSANGCSVTESITVNATPAVTATMLVIEDSLNCDLLPIGELQILPDGGLTPYTYRWSNGTTNQTAASLAAGNYTATVTDANGCTVSASGSVFAPVVPTPNAFINNAGTTATTVTWGSSATINAGNSQNNVSYQWIGSSALNIANATATSTTVTPSKDSTYLIRLVATSVNGCMVSDTLYLTVMSMMQIPTAFSPNGDNNNDRFRPLNINTEYIRTFRIFNRWGEIVYDNKSLSDGGWDGTINGTEQPRDSYIYILEVADPVTNKTSQLRGEFTLVR